jgi:hypothetical protein
MLRLFFDDSFSVGEDETKKDFGAGTTEEDILDLAESLIPLS